MPEPPEKRVVQEGDCVLSLAHKAGVPVDRVMTHPENAELTAKRDCPSILAPGDEIFIPERELKTEPVATEQRHRFQRTEEKAEIRIRIHEFDKPRANEPYYVLIGDERVEGSAPNTDEDGLVVCQIPPDAGKVTVVVGEQEDEFEVYLGYIDPLDSESGLHGRLENLGFYEGGVQAPWSDKSSRAMRDFLRQQNPENEEPDCSDPEDPMMREQLKSEYGS